MKRHSILAAVLMATTAAMAADWPQFRGPNADGVAPQAMMNADWKTHAPKEMWRISMSDDGFAGPAVANGRLYIIDHKGDQDVVRCIGMADGKDLWTFAYNDLANANFGFSRATPTVRDGKVYTVSYQGKVHCLDADTGKVVWKMDMVRQLGGQMPGWGFAQSPVIDGEKLIVCPGAPTGSVVALDRNTGRVIWKSGTDKAGYSTPVIGMINGVKQYIVFSGTSLNGYGEGGKLLWTVPWKTSYDVNAAQPIVLGNGVFISSGYGIGCAIIQIEGNKAKPIWKTPAMQQQFTSAIVHEGLIYGTTDPGELVCLNPKTGQTLWRQGGFEKGGVVATDAELIALTGNEGELVLTELSPKGYRELGRTRPVGGQSWTAPILADGRVIVRNKQALVCLDVTGR